MIKLAVYYMVERLGWGKRLFLNSETYLEALILGSIGPSIIPTFPFFPLPLFPAPNFLIRRVEEVEPGKLSLSIGQT